MIRQDVRQGEKNVGDSRQRIAKERPEACKWLQGQPGLRYQDMGVEDAHQLVFHEEALRG